LLRYYRPALLCALLALMGAASPARAHDISLSGIRVLYRHSEVVVNVTTHISRLLRAEGAGRTTLTPVELDLAIRRRLHLRFEGKDPVAQQANVIGDNANDLLTWQAVLPASTATCEVLARLYPEDPNSRTVVTLMRDGQVCQEALLDAAHPDLLRSQPVPRPLTVALRYIHEGIGHIFGGPDHVLFVLGLILLGGTLKTLLRTVTAFTLAHSVTLTLAATGIWSPSPRIVEPLIALSIVAIAVENLRSLRHRGALEQGRTSLLKEDQPGVSLSPARDLRPYYAFGFGLIHGFGFAGALAEVGLPKAALGVALASFNIGVEIGQVAIILMMVPVLAWLGKTRPAALRRLAMAGTLIIGIAGAYWFFNRLGPL
jgi:hypothetical protein